ncbi:MAG: site-specific integrase [Finegoldia magna]|nr:site-specific integrase [Finegoldia magna]
MKVQLKQVTSYEDRKVKTFTKMDMENLSRELKVKTKIARYKQLFEFAIKTLELNMKNTARDIQSNFKKDKDTVIVSVSEFENEIKPLFKKDEHLLILDIAFYTGLRSSEIAGLTYDDIFPTHLIVNKQFNKRTNSFTPPKSINSTRKVPISNKLYKEIIEYRNKQKIISTDKRLFPKRFTTQPTYIKLRKVTKGTKFDGMNLHSLRHSYTTNLITNGIDFKTASRIVGDTVETVMKTYSHYTEQGYKQVEQLINSI